MLISGKTENLPSGTKIWVEIIQQPGHAQIHGEGPMDENVVIADDGSFRAKISTPTGAPFTTGDFRIRITSFFSSVWQSADVLSKAGVTGLDNLGRSDVYTDPRAIPNSPDFKPDDPEFPKASRHLEAIREVHLGPIPADHAAIAAVKGATLVVAGRGRSSMSVGRSVDFFASAPGFTPLTWSAVAEPNGKWTVTLHSIDGGKEETAQWAYDSNTKSVKYLDPRAKTLSYVPAN